MIHHLNVNAKEKVISLGAHVVYGNRREWCDATWRPLELSVMRSRQFFYYDEPEKLPVIVFFCGGGWTNIDHNVWTPELAWFAKRGYAVVSVYYSVTARTRFPMQIEDCKLAIRWLRAHAEQFALDTDRMVVMGESAGGYMAGLTALAGEQRKYDVGEYLQYSSAVRGAICYYPGTDMRVFEDLDPSVAVVPPDIREYDPLPELVTPDSPPMMLLHGTRDSQVPLMQSELLYDALEKNGVRAELVVLNGAEHADAPFFQPETKQMVLDFIDETLKV